MAQVVFSRNAASNLERLHRFLAEKNPDAAARAVNAIVDRLGALARFPGLGSADPDRPDARQFFIRFEAAGYVVRYRAFNDTVTVLAIRHMREAGYAEEPSRPPPRAPSSRRRRS
jgi:plasmid stabilization system protein ParE